MFFIKSKICASASIFLFSFASASQAQTVSQEQVTALQGLAPFGLLNSTPAGRNALQENFNITGSIQNGNSSIPFLLPFSQQQQQALRDAQITSSNAYQLADGLGTKLQNAYQSLVTYTSPNNGITVSSTGLSSNVNNLISYTNQLTGNDASLGKYFFANGTVNGTTTTTNPQLLAILNQPGFQVDTYGVGYNLPAGPTPTSDPYGDARPFQTLVANGRPLVLFNGDNFFGNPSGNSDYLYGPTQNLTASPAFPSGHTTYGNTESLLLAILVPQRYQQMVTRGVEYGANRIIMGAHYATDVVGGRTLAYYDVAQMMANSANYLGAQSISSNNQVNGGASNVTVSNYQALVAAAKSDVTMALQGTCGGSIAKCAAQDTSRFSNPSANKNFYQSTLTFGLPRVYGGNISAVNYRTFSTETYNAGFLLLNRLPYLTNDQRADVVTSTQYTDAAGNFLDNGSSFGYFSRIDLFSAGGGYGAFNDLTGDVSITMNAASGGFNAYDTWSNNITGNRGFTLNGTGVMQFTGVSSYSGATIVNGGALLIDGSITSNVRVNNGGLLGGRGSFGGGLINSGGVISPGNSTGTITSNGNLTLQNGSLYLVEVSGANADRIAVNGAATVNGATLLLNTSQPAYVAGRRFNVLSSTSGLTGTFENVAPLQSYSFLTSYLGYDENNAYVGYGLAPFSTAAKNINQRNVGNALTIAALGPVNALGAPILNALFLGNYANAQAVMDTVSGSGLAGVQSTSMQVGQMASSAVSDQIAFWRSGETQDATGVTSQEGNNARNYMAYAPAGRNVAAKGPIRLNTKGDLVAAVAPRTFRAWGSMFGGGANFQTDAGRGAAASTAGFYGGLIGLDYQLTPNLLVGVALGGSSASFSVGSLSTNGALTGFHAGLYGAYTMGASYVALNETFSAWDNQTTRKAGGYALMPYEQLTAGFRSTEFRTRLEAGHGIPVAGIKATPFIAAEIAAYQTNGFTERSSAVASTFALKNNGQAINSLPTFVGVRLSDAFTLANGWRLAPIGSVAYVHEFFPQRQFTNILTSMPGAEFNVSGPRSTFNLVQTKLGAQLNLTNQLALYSDFQGEFSYVSQSFGGKAGAKYWW